MSPDAAATITTNSVENSKRRRLVGLRANALRIETTPIGNAKQQPQQSQLMSPPTIDCVAARTRHRQPDTSHVELPLPTRAHRNLASRGASSRELLNARRVSHDAASMEQEHIESDGDSEAEDEDEEAEAEIDDEEVEIDDDEEEKARSPPSAPNSPTLITLDEWPSSRASSASVQLIEEAATNASSSAATVDSAVRQLSSAATGDDEATMHAETTASVEASLSPEMPQLSPQLSPQNDSNEAPPSLCSVSGGRERPAAVCVPLAGWLVGEMLGEQCARVPLAERDKKQRWRFDRRSPAVSRLRGSSRAFDEPPVCARYRRHSRGASICCSCLRSDVDADERCATTGERLHRCAARQRAYSPSTRVRVRQRASTAPHRSRGAAKTDSRSTRGAAAVAAASCGRRAARAKRANAKSSRHNFFFNPHVNNNKAGWRAIVSSSEPARRPISAGCL